MQFQNLDIEIDIPYEWNQLAAKAVNISNEISAILSDNGDLNSIDDQFYFDLVEGNLDPDTMIIGSGIILAPNVHPTNTLWAPFAFVNANGTVESVNLAEFYDYVNPMAVWYGPLAQRTSWDHVNIEEGR